MSNLYLWFKVLHVLAVAVWLGTSVSMIGILSQLNSTADRRGKAVLASLCAVISQRIIAPAAGLTFLIGLVTVFAGKVHMTLWLWWGVGASVIVLGAGGSLFRINFEKLAKLLNDPSGSDTEVNQVLGRLRTLGYSGVALVAVTVAVMVLKPT